MTAYEIISIFIGILTLLFTFGSLIIALLTFLDKRNKRKYKCLSCLTHRIGGVRKDISPTRSIHFGVGAFFVYNISYAIRNFKSFIS